MNLKEDIIRILERSNDDSVKVLKIKERVGFLSEAEIRNRQKLLSDLEKVLIEANNAYKENDIEKAMSLLSDSYKIKNMIYDIDCPEQMSLLISEMEYEYTSRWKI